MQLQTNAEGEAAPKRRRSRKSDWRREWIKLTNGTTLENRAIKQTMRGPKLLSSSMPRVIPNVEALRAQGIVVGPPSSWTKFEPPALFVEKADFVGLATTRGIDARVAEKEFYKMVNADRSPKNFDKKK